MTAAADAVFLDTNVLVYANVNSAPLHMAALSDIQRLHDSGRELWISRQVIREYLAVLSRPQTFSAPLPMATLVQRVQYFEQQFRVAEDSSAVTSELLQILQDVAVGGKQVHDANIVATMRSHGISDLLTHNAADFSRFAHLVAVVTLETRQ